MIEQIVSLIERIGHLIRMLNEIFYFYIDIETSISWTVVFLMWILSKMVTKYYENDGKMTSDELIKLLAIYLFFLSAILASYVDFRGIMKRMNPEHSFFMITIIALMFVIVLAWGGATGKKNTKRRWILFSLYTPILLLMLTNGRIVEQRFNTLKNLLPRTNLTFINLPGEVDQLYLGGLIEPERVERIERIINAHEAVRESAVVGYQDEDKLIKPYALVVLNSDYTRSEKIKEDIKEHVEQVIQKSRIIKDMYPSEIEFVDPSRLPTALKVNVYHKDIEKILNVHKAVHKSVVIPHQGKTIAYVSLEAGFAPSRRLGKELIDYILGEFKKNNEISIYMKPQWVCFVESEKIPRTSTGSVDHRKLQKMLKNWSDVFPDAPFKNPFEEEKK